VNFFSTVSIGDIRSRCCIRERSYNSSHLISFDVMSTDLVSFELGSSECEHAVCRAFDQSDKTARYFVPIGRSHGELGRFAAHSR